MKYIRMKDGIRDITGFIDKGSYWQNPNCGLDYIGKEHILKQADIIEELLNRYVVINKGHYKIYSRYQFEQLNISRIAQMLKSGFEIYGAIWTKKGLIYVTKVNEVGGLELL